MLVCQTRNRALKASVLLAVAYFYLFELMPSSTLFFRPLRACDLPGLHAVQVACYGGYFLESQQLFARRLQSPVNCSWVCVAHAGRGAPVLAYLAAYFSQSGKITPLYGEFEASEFCDSLYLHDMAVHPRAAGRGIANALLQKIQKQKKVKKLAYSNLVAVQGAQSFWQRQDFVAVAIESLLPEQQSRLQSYGDGAIYMQKKRVFS